MQKTLSARFEAFYFMSFFVDCNFFYAQIWFDLIQGQISCATLFMCSRFCRKSISWVRSGWGDEEFCETKTTTIVWTPQFNGNNINTFYQQSNTFSVEMWDSNKHSFIIYVCSSDACFYLINKNRSLCTQSAKDPSTNLNHIYLMIWFLSEYYSKIWKFKIVRLSYSYYVQTILSFRSIQWRKK